MILYYFNLSKKIKIGSDDINLFKTMFTFHYFVGFFKTSDFQKG